jgi:hypothetical protein
VAEQFTVEGTSRFPKVTALGTEGTRGDERRGT